MLGATARHVTRQLNVDVGKIVSGWLQTWTKSELTNPHCPPYLSTCACRVMVVYLSAGAKDSGDNSRNNTDTTNYLPPDKAWLDIVAAYLRALSERTGRQPSWFFWAWNANSGMSTCPPDDSSHVSVCRAGLGLGALASCPTPLPRQKNW